MIAHLNWWIYSSVTFMIITAEGKEKMQQPARFFIFGGKCMTVKSFHMGLSVWEKTAALSWRWRHFVGNTNMTRTQHQFWLIYNKLNVSLSSDHNKNNGPKIKVRGQKQEAVGVYLSIWSIHHFLHPSISLYLWPAPFLFLYQCCWCCPVGSPDDRFTSSAGKLLLQMARLSVCTLHCFRAYCDIHWNNLTTNTLRTI